MAMHISSSPKIFLARLTSAAGALSLLLVSSAYAQQSGAWGNGFAQGVEEHIVENGLGNQFNVSCNVSSSVAETGILIYVLGKPAPANSKVNIILDAEQYTFNTDQSGTIETKSHVDADNFNAFLKQLKSARTMLVQLADGRTSKFSTRGAAQSFANSECKPAFAGPPSVAQKTQKALTQTAGQTAIQGSGPSFDCAKAQTPVEKTICSDPKLAKLDKQILDLYRQALATQSDPTQLKETQAVWRKLRTSCGDVACLFQVYSARASMLQQVIASAPAVPAPTAPQPAVVQAQTQSKTSSEYVVTLPPGNKGLRLRSGPSTDNNILQLLPANTAVTVLKRQSDGWWNVRENLSGAEGWVLSAQNGVSFLSQAEKVTSAGTTAQTEKVTNSAEGQEETAAAKESPANTPEREAEERLHEAEIIAASKAKAIQDANERARREADARIVDAKKTADRAYAEAQERQRLEQHQSSDQKAIARPAEEVDTEREESLAEPTMPSVKQSPSDKDKKATDKSEPTRKQAATPLAPTKADAQSDQSSFKNMFGLGSAPLEEALRYVNRDNFIKTIYGIVSIIALIVGVKLLQKLLQIVRQKAVDYRSQAVQLYSSKKSEALEKASHSGSAIVGTIRKNQAKLKTFGVAADEKLTEVADSLQAGLERNAQELRLHAHTAAQTASDALNEKQAAIKGAVPVVANRIAEKVVTIRETSKRLTNQMRLRLQDTKKTFDDATTGIELKFSSDQVNRKIPFGVSTVSVIGILSLYMFSAPDKGPNHDVTSKNVEREEKTTKNEQTEISTAQKRQAEERETQATEKKKTEDAEKPKSTKLTELYSKNQEEGQRYMDIAHDWFIMNQEDPITGKATRTILAESDDGGDAVMLGCHGNSTANLVSLALRESASFIGANKKFVNVIYKIGAMQPTESVAEISRGDRSTVATLIIPESAYIKSFDVGRMVFRMKDGDRQRDIIFTLKNTQSHIAQCDE